MADVIDYRIFGDDLQLVEIELDPARPCAPKPAR